MNVKWMRERWWIFVLVGGYLLSGLYIVRGNEQGIVRRFGRLQQTPLGPGLHYALPWPFSRVDRVNRNELRTLGVGLTVAEEAQLTSFDAAAGQFRGGEFLTGDKNVLLLSAQVQYRVTDAAAYLYRVESPERLLKMLTEAEVTSLVSRSGVDYVHPLGLNALRGDLSRRLQEEAEEQGLGISVEDVVLSDVRPPGPVKQAFLDVSNARAERSRLVSEAQTVAERLQVESTAAAQKIMDEAAIERQSRVAIARSESERFLALLAQIPKENGVERRAALGRMYLECVGDLLPTLKGRILTEGDRPLDLSIWNGSDGSDEALEGARSTVR